MPGNTLKCSFALAVALWLAPTAGALAADAGPAPAAGEVAAAPVATSELELLELDEVVVHGERLITRIVSAEDDFYKLYNELNKDDRYDVNCPFLTLGDAYSRINSRLCLPGFVASAIADYTAYKMSCEPQFSNFDSDRNGRISRMEASANADLFSQFDDLDQDDDAQLDQYGEYKAFENWAVMNMNCYRPPPPELVLMEGTDAWYKHMMAVTNSDPRLREMAGKLDDMHRELVAVQRRYQDMSDEEAAARYVDRTPDMRRMGPRR